MLPDCQVLLVGAPAPPVLAATNHHHPSESESRVAGSWAPEERDARASWRHSTVATSEAASNATPLCTSSMIVKALPLKYGTAFIACIVAAALAAKAMAMILHVTACNFALSAVLKVLPRPFSKCIFYFFGVFSSSPFYLHIIAPHAYGIDMGNCIANAYDHDTGG